MLEGPGRELLTASPRAFRALASALEHIAEGPAAPRAAPSLPFPLPSTLPSTLASTPASTPTPALTRARAVEWSLELDPVVRVHVGLALDAIDFIVRELLPNTR